MSKQWKIQRRGTWLNRSDICQTLAVSTTNFDKSWRPLVSEVDTKSEKGQVFFHVRSVVDAYLEREVSRRVDAMPKTMKVLPRDPEDDDLMEGPVSDWLERFRQRRTEMLEIDLEVRRGSLIPREEIAQLLSRLAGVLRPAGEKLQRQHGPDAGAIYNEAIDEVERLVEVCGIVNSDD